MAVRKDSKGNRQMQRKLKCIQMGKADVTFIVCCPKPDPFSWPHLFHSYILLTTGQ